jgi:hypothetical protein
LSSSKKTGNEFSDPVPLTRMEIEHLLDKAGFPTSNEKFLEVVFRIARMIEKAHGITMDERRKTH